MNAPMMPTIASVLSTQSVPRVRPRAFFSPRSHALTCVSTPASRPILFALLMTLGQSINRATPLRRRSGELGALNQAPDRAKFSPARGPPFHVPSDSPGGLIQR